MAKVITLQIEDEYFEEFLSELEKKIENDKDISEEDVRIYGLSVKEYRKVIKEKIK